MIRSLQKRLSLQKFLILNLMLQQLYTNKLRSGRYPNCLGGSPVLSFSSHRLQGLAPDEAVFEASIAGLSSKLDGYEDILGRQRYLAGDVSPIIAHVFFLSQRYLRLLSLATHPCGFIPHSCRSIAHKFWKRHYDEKRAKHDSVIYCCSSLSTYIALTSKLRRWWNDISSRPSCIAVQNGDPVQL